MVFSVQCPNPKCRKFMLAEERDRNKVVPCLICKSPVRLAAGANAQQISATKGKPAPDGGTA